MALHFLIFFRESNVIAHEDKIWTLYELISLILLILNIFDIHFPVQHPSIYNF